MYIDAINVDVKKEYILPVEISVFDADFAKRMKLSSMLKYQHLASEKQMACLNLAYDDILKMGVTFVAINCSAKINRTPLFEEKLKLVTWNRGIKGARFYRNFDWIDSNGEKVIESCSVCALVNVKTHSLLRPNSVQWNIPSYFDRENAVGIPTKVKTPNTLSSPKIKTVRFSELDYNCHLNHAFYADIIEDYMPCDMTDKRVTSFSIDYLKEAVLGDEIEIKTAIDSNKAYYSGVHSHGDCFKAVCTFENV